MGYVKYIHVACAMLSIMGFISRSLLFIYKSPLVEKRWVKLTPHVIDTLFLTTAIYLAIQLSVSPITSPWLAAKIVALIIYIALGFGVIHFAHSKFVQIAMLGLAVTVFMYIAAVAVTKSPFILW